MALAPSGELSSIGIARETTYGTAPASGYIFYPSDNVAFESTNEFNQRPGARKRIGTTRPGTGMIMGKGSFEAEADPDTLGALLALVMGAEAIAPNAGNPATAAAVSTTIVGPVSPGLQTVTPASLTGITAGSSLTIDAGANAETVVVKVPPLGGTFTALFRQSHAAGVAVVSAPLVLAYDHTFTLASPRPFFTAQINEVIQARNCVGNKISQLSIAPTSKAILTCKVSTEYQADFLTTTPVTPIYSNLEAYSFTTAGNYGQINGAQSDATIMSWDSNIATGLVAEYPNFGGGRLRSQLPEEQTKVTGGMMLGFETTTLNQAFWGNAAGATGPQNLVLPVSLSYKFVSTDGINASVVYSLQVIMGQCMISANSRPIRAGNYISQSVKFLANETLNGANDDVRFVVTSAAAGASI